MTAKRLAEAVRNERDYLSKLCGGVMEYVAKMDALMKSPPTFDRGRQIAKLIGDLERLNYRALRHGLGYDWEKVDKIKSEILKQ